MGVMKDFVFKTKVLEVEEELGAVEWAEKNGWQARKVQYIGRRTCPDRFFYGHGVLLPIELKRPSARTKPRGGLSVGQEREFARYAAAGVTVKVCYTSEEVIEYLKGFMDGFA